VHDGGDGVRVGDGVAGVDDQVRLKAGERADPGVLAVLGSGDVQVGDVQQPDRARAGRQDRDVEATQRVRIALDQRAVGHRRRAGPRG